MTNNKNTPEEDKKLNMSRSFYRIRIKCINNAPHQAMTEGSNTKVLEDTNPNPSRVQANTVQSGARLTCQAPPTSGAENQQEPTQADYVLSLQPPRKAMLDSGRKRDTEKRGLVRR